MSIYDKLNKEQRIAVEHDKGPMLILAGAGSGKTRVLTHRVAYLIEERGVNPYNILALTFTNKAAKEMRERVDKIVGFGAENVWVSTFHSTCVRILRRWIESLGYARSFTIYDSDDQKRLMKEVCKYLSIDTKNLKEKTILNVISKAKDELVTSDEFERRAAGDAQQRKYAAAYKEYQKRLKANNALDFDDLIFRTVELFRTNNEALEYYRRRFRYIMVDEYQDTNTSQFTFISLLASYTNESGETEHNLCVVGDDDQSIYKFRGANIRNILDFETSYPDAAVIKLEQNYRSTKSILSAANEVIHNNLGRKEKALWTDNGEGDPVSFTQYSTDLEEAASIVRDIAAGVESGGRSYNDFAILYRTNAQSRVFEERLVTKNIPYRLVGGVNFYQRKEIKDILAYLRVIDNAQDNISVKRIINVPKRGIGLTTIDRIDEYAVENGISFYQALTRAQSIPSVGRGIARLESFVALIEGLKSAASQSWQLENIIDEILEATGYLEEVREQEEEEKAQEREDNIGELVNKLSAYVDDAEGEATLGGFLEEVSLVGDIDSYSEDNNVVVLMTLHSAKGLEFPVVYMVGMEEGVFPGYMSINADNPELEIEEERRLCYVGITRAQKQLNLSAAAQRMLHGETQYNRPSRFIGEIPRYMLTIKSDKKTGFLGDERSYGESPVRNAQQMDFSKLYSFGSEVAYNSAIKTKAPVKDIGGGGAELEYDVGDTVSHVKFGNGVVKEIVRGGKDYEVTVEFAAGVKKMLASFARLKPVSPPNT